LNRDDRTEPSKAKVNVQRHAKRPFRHIAIVRVTN
jgi:hypothetical protein